MTTRQHFMFNTALVGVAPENGKLDDNELRRVATALRGKIMSEATGDGIESMHIARFGMEVSFYTEITDQAKVIAAVEAAVAWLAEQTELNAFPLRADKTPAVTPEAREENKPTGKTVVKAMLNTDLYHFPVDKDGEQATSTIDYVMTKLVEVDGVRGVDVRMNGVTLIIRDTHLTVEQAKSHIFAVLKELREKDETYFPFLGEGLDFTLEFSVEPTIV